MNALEHRIPPPIVVLLLGAAMWLTARYTPHAVPPGRLATMCAVTVFAIGLLIGVSAIRAFRRAKTTIDPVNLDAASVLVTTGIFRITRNPMYVAFTALLTAWALLLRSPWALAGVVVFVLFTRRFQILPEERALQQKFGTDYDNYRQRVRRWL